MKTSMSTSMPGSAWLFPLNPLCHLLFYLLWVWSSQGGRCSYSFCLNIFVFIYGFFWIWWSVSTLGGNSVEKMKRDMRFSSCQKCLNYQLPCGFTIGLSFNKLVRMMAVRILLLLLPPTSIWVARILFSVVLSYFQLASLTLSNRSASTAASLKIRSPTFSLFPPSPS